MRESEQKVLDQEGDIVFETDEPEPVESKPLKPEPEPEEEKEVYISERQ